MSQRFDIKRMEQCHSGRVTPHRDFTSEGQSYVIERFNIKGQCYVTEICFTETELRFKSILDPKE